MTKNPKDTWAKLREQFFKEERQIGSFKKEKNLKLLLIKEIQSIVKCHYLPIKQAKICKKEKKIFLSIWNGVVTRTVSYASGEN